MTSLCVVGSLSARPRNRGGCVLCDFPGPEEDHDDPEGGGVAAVAGADFGNEIGGEAGRCDEQKEGPSEMIPFQGSGEAIVAIIVSKNDAPRNPL